MTTIVVKDLTAETGRLAARAVLEYEARARRLAWERRWQEMTGRPWGWVPPRSPRMVVSLGRDPRGMDAQVWVDDLPLHPLIRNMAVRKGLDEASGGVLVLEIPLPLVDVRP